MTQGNESSGPLLALMGISVSTYSKSTALIKIFNCETQPSNSKGWVALTSLVRPSRPALVTWTFMPIYLDFEHWCQYIYNIFRWWRPIGDHLVTNWWPLGDHINSILSPALSFALYTLLLSFLQCTDQLHFQYNWITVNILFGNSQTSDHMAYQWLIEMSFLFELHTF